MTKRPFQKPPTTYTEQVAILRDRGMIIDDEAQAEFYLSHLNYYRLGAYWLPFEATHNPHCFQVGVLFKDVLNLYVFDRELRLLVMDAIERIEVSVRAHWAYCLAHNHDPHGYLDQSLALNQNRWQQNKADLEREVARSDETFIQHLKNNHTETFPPVWAASEIMSFGLLSRWYSNLKPPKTRRWIARAYGADDDLLASWLHHLAIIRNFCAHHSRLWNRSFAVTPQKPKNKPRLMAPEIVDNRRLYNALLIMIYLMDIIAPGHHWRVRLKELLIKHEHLLPNMGFPENWKTRAIWQDVSSRRVP